MRSVILFILVCLCGISCKDVKIVEGSGNKVKEVRQVKNYTNLEISRGIIVEAIQSDSISLCIETDDNILPLVKTKIEGDVLEISMSDEHYVMSGTEVRVFLRVPDLQNIEVEKSGLFRGLGVWNLKDLNVDLSTSANFSNDTTWIVDDLNISASTVSSYNMKVQSKKINIENNTGANGYLNGTTESFSVKGELGARLNAKYLDYKKIENVNLSSGANLGVKERIEFDVSKGGFVY